MSSSSNARGSALVELALALPFLLLFVFGAIDVGQLVRTRLILTNVSREGGSIASRQTPLDAAIPALLVSAATPLVLGGADGKVVVSRINCGTSAANPLPTISSQLSQGSLAASSGVQLGRANLGLTTNLYNHLVFKTANGVADISEVTVVEVFYKYRPITPLTAIVPGLLTPDSGGLILSSRAVF